MSHLLRMNTKCLAASLSGVARAKFIYELVNHAYLWRANLFIMSILYGTITNSRLLAAGESKFIPRKKKKKNCTNPRIALAAW